MHRRAHDVLTVLDDIGEVLERIPSTSRLSERSTSIRPLERRREWARRPTTGYRRAARSARKTTRRGTSLRHAIRRGRESSSAHVRSARIRRPPRAVPLTVVAPPVSMLSPVVGP